MSRPSHRRAVCVSHCRMRASWIAALVESGYSEGQRVTVGTLQTIAERAEAVGAEPPAITILGDVVTLSPAWPRT